MRSKWLRSPVIQRKSANLGVFHQRLKVVDSFWASTAGITR